MTELKQVNFKIDATLLEQLKTAARTKGLTITSLIVEGIHQVLGIRPSPQINDRDFELYAQIDKLVQKLQNFEDYQSTVDIKTSRRIDDVEARLAILGDLSTDTITDIVHRIAKNIYEELEEKKTTQPKVNIDAGIDKRINNRSSKKPKVKKADIVSSIDSGIDKNDSFLPEKAQLTLKLDSNDEELPTDAQQVNSSELIKILKALDPSAQWNSDKLTAYRRLKKHQGKWHTVSGCQFKYAGENNAQESNVKYLWWLVHSKERKANQE